MTAAPGDRLAAVTGPDDVKTSFTYDGFLPLSTTWSCTTPPCAAGTVSGTVSRTYDDNLRVIDQTVSGTPLVSFGYDADDLLTQAGAMTIGRNPTTGFIESTALGQATDARSYNSFGELDHYTASFAGTPLFDVSYGPRDALGRITQKTETIGGTTTTYAYGYSVEGRLETVSRNGTLVAAYAYDANGNRTAAPGLSTAPQYDGQDRLLSYGSATYTYTANGELATKTVGSAVTQYHYDALGSLRAVDLPDGRRIDYVVDGLGRRIGKKINGTLVQGFLWDDQLRIVAELDGQDRPVSRFVYGTHSNVPEYMVRYDTSGQSIGAYRVITDHLGSPRLVVKTDAPGLGMVVQRMDFDEFGKLINDTSPGVQPFGFAGGLYDADLGLVNFGARYYEAASGRWISKDPMGFDATDSNMYGYVGQDPTNLADPYGLDVTVCFYEDAAHGFGHVGYAVGGEAQTRGFYGTDPKWYKSPGEVRLDQQKQKECKKLKSPPPKDECMLKCRAERQNDPGQYNLFTRQCTAFVRDCLIKCNLPAGSYTGPLPGGLFSELPN